MKNDPTKHVGRPRKYASSQQRAAAYRNRAAGQGLVRVSVMVPAGRAGDLREIAAAMRQSSKRTRSQVEGSSRPPAPRHWSPEADAEILRIWRDGGTANDAMAAIGRTADEIARRLVALNEAGSVREVTAEFAARARAESLTVRRKIDRAAPFPR